MKGRDTGGGAGSSNHHVTRVRRRKTLLLATLTRPLITAFGRAGGFPAPG
jgi:hypothetical protein